MIDCDLGAKPPDLSFDIGPSPLPAAPPTCEYAYICDDITTTPPVETFDFSGSVDVIKKLSRLYIRQCLYIDSTYEAFSGVKVTVQIQYTG